MTSKGSHGNRDLSLINEEQHGFQADKSCETRLMTITHDFTKCLNENS